MYNACVIGRYDFPFDVVHRINDWGTYAVQGLNLNYAHKQTQRLCLHSCLCCVVTDTVSNKQVLFIIAIIAH